MTDWTPDAAWLNDRFDRRLRPRLFADRGAEAQPVVVFLGAQPGAGKTRAGSLARELHSRPLVVINGDNFRSLHPDFKRLQTDHPQRMPVVTQAVSGPMVERSIEYARTNRISVLVEGTFRDPALVTQTAEAFHASGFDVHVVVLAVPPQVSRAATFGRFTETLGTDQNRWTPPEAHENALRGLPTTADALARSPIVGRLTAVTRDGHVLVDSTAPGRERAAAIRAQLDHSRIRPLTLQERALVDATIAAVTTGSGTSAAQQSALAVARAALADGVATSTTRGLATTLGRLPSMIAETRGLGR